MVLISRCILHLAGMVAVPYIDENLCTGCGICLDACPQGAISLEGFTARIDPELCTDCARCVDVCVTEAISAPQTPAESTSSGASNVPESPQPVLASTRALQVGSEGLVREQGLTLGQGLALGRRQGSGQRQGLGRGKRQGPGRDPRCGRGGGCGQGRSQRKSGGGRRGRNN